jgi:hypothetical protein
LPSGGEKGIKPISGGQLAAYSNEKKDGSLEMLFILYYVVAITVLILHFTGALARYNLEWLILVLAVTVFPAVIYL